jgi:thiosulfate/3-mercaptopyruvate sulfurtransferase
MIGSMPARLRGSAAAASVVSLLVLSSACAGGSDPGPSQEPWGANTVSAADLVKELESPGRPVVVCTAPPSMYRNGHVPGAVLHGPMTSPAVHDELAAWAQPLPRDTNLVVYCGCCPLEHCPNLRPAYKLLAGMGFTRLRVLILPQNFGTDWVNRGYPIER